MLVPQHTACEFQDWETASFMLSVRIYHTKYLGGGGGDDTMVGQLNRSGVFDVCSFYKSLLKALSVFFPLAMHLKC